MKNEMEEYLNKKIPEQGEKSFTAESTKDSKTLEWNVDWKAGKTYNAIF